MSVHPAVLACALVACWAPPPPAKRSSSPTPAVAAPRALAAKIDEADALCCCTFHFVSEDELELDHAIVRWESQRLACLRGGAPHPRGTCVAWSFCGYAAGAEPKSLADRPDLQPPAPLPREECCCDTASAHGEDIRVMARPTCAATPNSACIDAGFCGRDDASETP